MADGKWISDLHADTPLTEAARHVLAVRLRVVQELLPLAVHEADRDPEHVHQLRVGARRADAALRIFASCLPRKTYKSARARLRRLRQAAGEARDGDVFLIALTARRVKQTAKEQPGLDFLIGHAFSRRVAAQGELEAAAAEERSDLDALLTEATGAVRPPDDLMRHATLLDLARPLLSGLLHDLEWTASGDLEDYNHLHQVRIAGKRLRYGMEVFADCFPPTFREDLYPRIEEMQEILGLANDSHVAVVRLSDLRGRLRRAWPGEWKRLRPGVESLLRFHTRRLPQERKHFVQWWDDWKQTGGPALNALLQSGNGAATPPALSPADDAAATSGSSG